MSNTGYKSFASHYILLPGGRIGKWPVLTVDETGVIVQVEVRDAFKERPSLEMHPGILLPAFVDLCETGLGRGELQPNLNRHFSRGTILLGSSCHNQTRPYPKLTVPVETCGESPDFLARDGQADVPLFDRMQQYPQNSSDEQLFANLFWATQWGAAKSLFDNQMGQLKEGFKPGVLVLQKIDLHSMQITPIAQVKWLSVPVLDQLG